MCDLIVNMKTTNRTQEETEKDNKKQNKQSQHQTREARICSKALCCSTKARLSISSASSSSVESDRSSRFSDQHGSLSSLAHYMVQEKLEQMIRETQEATQHQAKIRQEKARRARRRSEGSIGSTKFIVMMAMEKFSYDPREDFRDSMVEMIVANKIKEADELRSLLEYYLSMNPREYRSAILEIFYEVCADLFRS
ncbi:PREDICTED: probable transcription repressor OFP9 [Camelina sativa]|uniref:Transcription repressor n=1 Tax=Camelina sativa TaxID=90675 RepID=A0ABM0WAP0_CAMSA|nr:PREDICTED: probable transcription repressor OFP9 [Camelina sativa]